MPLFSKPTVASFWEWWTAGGAATVERLVADGDLSALVAELAPRIPRARPELAWEVGGAPGRLELIVRPDGVGKNRALAEAWRRAAADTSGWTFLTARPPRDVGTASIPVPGGSQSLMLADFRWEAMRNVDTLLLVVRAHHPGFASLTASQMTGAAESALHAVLGDDEFDRWVLAVAPATAPEEHFVDGGGLLEAIGRVRAQRDAQLWYEFEDDGERSMFRGRRSRLRPVDRPSFDTHVQVSSRYALSGDPRSEPATRLNRIERGWNDLPGRIELMAVGEGSGQRIWHFYRDGTDDGALEHVRAWVKKFGNMTMLSRRDPDWTDVG